MLLPDGFSLFVMVPKLISGALRVQAAKQSIQEATV
jgi:hypothetical protein